MYEKMKTSIDLPKIMFREQDRGIIILRGQK